MIIRLLVEVDVDEASFAKEFPGAGQDAIPRHVQEQVNWGVSNQLQLWGADGDLVGLEIQ